MTDSMVERVARAIRRKVAALNPTGFSEADVLNLAFEPAELEIAHAAIEAMLEPTEAMKAAYFPDEDGGLIWRDMIDAALAEPVPK